MGLNVKRFDGQYIPFSSRDHLNTRGRPIRPQEMISLSRIVSHYLLARVSPLETEGDGRSILSPGLSAMVKSR